MESLESELAWTPCQLWNQRHRQHKQAQPAK